MNLKEYSIKFILEEPEIDEVLLSLFHTIILHRTFPTLSFKDGAISYTSYIGTEDVDCSNTDVTYVRVSSKAIHERIIDHITPFTQKLSEDAKHNSSNVAKGSITLAFVTNRKGSWVLGADLAAWERWTINMEVRPSSVVHEDYRQKLSAQLKGEMLYILDCINTSENYLPELGSSQADCDNVIDFSMPEVSPYRFKISYVTGDSHQQQGKTAALRRF